MIKEGKINYTIDDVLKVIKIHNEARTSLKEHTTKTAWLASQLYHNKQKVMRLSRDEKRVFYDIKKKPGISKQGIVDSFKNKYSRVKVFKIINTLTEYDMIIARKDPKNRQMYNLFINNENLLTTLFETLNNLQYVYSTLLDKLENILNINKNRKQNNTKKNTPAFSILSNLILLYRDIFESYILEILLDWPKKTDDKKILDSSYVIFFSTMSSIFYRLSSIYTAYKDKFMDPDLDYPQLNILDQIKIFQPPAVMMANPLFIIGMINASQKLEIDNKIIIDLLDIAWKICYPTLVKERIVINDSISDIPLVEVEDWRDYFKPEHKFYIDYLTELRD